MSEPTPSINGRRKLAERRNGSEDRRRGAEGKRVVLEICRSWLHLSIVAPEARGEQDVLLCRSLRWRVEAPSLLGPGGAEELRIAVKQLTVEERIAGATTTVLLNGDLCVNRVAIGSSRQVDHEVSELTERSQIYLALGAGEKAAAAARVPLDARHEHAVLSVANRRTVEAVVRAAEDAGLELRAVEASGVALCRAHGELYNDNHPVFLVQFDEGAVELALAHRGRLLLEHRAGAAATDKSIGQLLDLHYDRLVRYCRRQGIEGDLSKALLVGDEELVAKAVCEPKSSRGVEIQRFDVSRADQHWSIREAKPTSQHVATLGGALESGEGVDAPNPLERWIAESRKHIRPMLLRSFAPLAATLLIAATLGVMNYQLYRENTGLSQRLAKVAPAQARANALRLKLLGKRALIEQLQKLDAQTPRTSLAGFLQRVGQCLPNDVWLENLQLLEGGRVHLRGVSYTDGGAYDFVGHLNRAPGMEQVALQETRADIGPKGPTTSFIVEANYTPSPADPDADGSIKNASNHGGSRGAVGRQNPQRPRAS